MRSSFLKAGWLLFIVVVVGRPSAWGQSAQPPAFLKVLLDYTMRPVKGAGGYSRVEHLYRTADSGWRAHRFIYPTMVPDAMYYLDDTATRRLQGPFVSYYEGEANQPGPLREQRYYRADTAEGRSYSWHRNGRMASSVLLRRGLMTDTVRYWHENGQLQQLGLLDSTGTGPLEAFYESGQRQQQGSMLRGRKHGLWTVYDDQGHRTMTVQLAADSVVSTTCFDSAGQPANGPCIYEREANFAGGLLGWRRFLEQNFQYPKEAIRNDIEGVVRFTLTVGTDGSVSDLEIVASPHPLLSNEVRRLMGRTPKWEPAIQFNKPVKTKAAQVVFFRLQ